jgi:hypothetical protein
VVQYRKVLVCDCYPDNYAQKSGEDHGSNAVPAVHDTRETDRPHKSWLCLFGSGEVSLRIALNKVLGVGMGGNGVVVGRLGLPKKTNILKEGDISSEECRIDSNHDGSHCHHLRWYRDFIGLGQ